MVVLGGVEGAVAHKKILETRGDGQTLSFAAIITAMMLAEKSSFGSADFFTTTRLSYSQSRCLTRRLCRMVVTVRVCASVVVLCNTPDMI